MKVLDGIVLAAEILAAVAAVAFVVLLFTNDPSSGSAPGGLYGTDDGAAIYADSCAQCHGADGSGGIGPPLGGGAVVEAFPDAEAEIAVVAEGRQGMPGFGDRLTPEQIEAVVEYTRPGL